MKQTLKKLSLVLMSLVVVMSMTACSSVPYSKYNLEDYITVPEYKGLETGKIEVSITDEEVEEEIQNRLTEAADTKTVQEGKVQNGDIVSIDYEGKIDGQPFEGGSYEGYSLMIGSNTFIEGFESGIIGHEVGETFDLNLTFPDPYTGNEELSGKPVVFTVTINSRQTMVVPELDMDFIEAQGSEAESVEAYRAEVKEEMEEAQQHSLEDEQKMDLWALVTDGAEVKTDEDGNELYPEEELDRAVEESKKEYEEYAASYEMDYETFVTEYTGQTVEEFEADLRTYAQETVKQEMILYYIADKEGITVSRGDIKDYYERFLEEYGIEDEKEFEEMAGMKMEEYFGGKEAVKRAVYLEKVQDMILENAKITDEVYVPQSQTLNMEDMMVVE